MGNLKKVLPGLKKDMEKELETEEDVAKLSSYQVKLDVFEGPFDLLLHMIDEDKLDLHQVSLTKITQGYLDYIKQLEKYSIVVASEFLIMAACLLEMKSKMLLPVKEEEQAETLDEDIEEDLLQRLAEYKVYKNIAEDLKDRKEIFQKVYTRYTLDEAKQAQEFFLVDVSLRDLVFAFKKVWDEAEARGETTEIIAENVNVDDMIKEILDKLNSEKSGVDFESFFADASKLAIIVMFLAMLELIRRKVISFKQDEIFGNIILYRAEG